MRTQDAPAIAASRLGVGRSAWSVRYAASFWSLALLQTLFLFAASAPSPLYPAYQARWHFSSVTLTAVYAVYALGSLVALLTCGRLSDHVGRRRVTVAGLLVQLVAMFAFIGAQGVEWLFVARILQGAATGVASSAISAWLLDLQPPDDPRLGALVGSIALIGGLALGALGAGLLAQYAPDPLHLVFWLLAVAYLVALVAMPFVPDVVQRRPGWLRSMRPVIGVPSSVRPLFVATAPSLVAMWAVGGLYLSLGPALAITITRSHGAVAGGLVIMALLGTGAVASFLVRASEPERLVVRGSSVLVVGLGVTLFAVATGSAPGLYLGSIVAGLGFGPAFSGVFRSLTRLAPPERRGALLAAIYVVIYVSFSVPIIVAGVAVTLYGLVDTAYVFGIVAMILAASTTLAVSRRAVRAEATT